MRREAEHGEIVAANLLALIFGKRGAQGFFLLAHGNAAAFLQQLLESPLAEGAAARAAYLIDQAVGGEIEIVARVVGEGRIAEGRLVRIAPIAEPGAVAFDLDDAIAVGAPEREARPGEGDVLLFGIDEADTGFEPVIGLAAVLLTPRCSPLNTALGLSLAAARSMRSSKPQAMSVMNAPGTPWPVQSPTITA